MDAGSRAEFGKEGLGTRTARWLAARVPLTIDETDLIRRFLSRRPEVPRTLVDVGAHRGGVTVNYAKSGWRVLAFEPDERNREALIQATRNLVGVVIDPRAVGSPTGKPLPLYSSPVSSGISSLAPFHESHRETYTVELVELRHVVPDFLGGSPLGVLKTDVEGFDLQALQSYDFDHSPAAVIAEYEQRKTLPLGYAPADLFHFLREQELCVFISEWYPVVEYGQRHRWKRFTTDIHALDPNGWGNFVAVSREYAPQFGQYLRALRWKNVVAGAIDRSARSAAGRMGRAQ